MVYKEFEEFKIHFYNIYIMQPISLLCLLITLLGIVQSGMISKGFLEVDYANAGLMSTLKFSFKLTTPLTETDFIKISLPFPLHATLAPATPATEGLSMPKDLTVTHQESLPNGYTPSSPLPTRTLTPSIDSSVYFLQFLTLDKKTRLPIKGGQWYIIQFELHSDNQAFKYQKNGQELEISITTLSGVRQNAQIYDDNPTFNYFHLEPLPVSGIVMEILPVNEV